MSAVWAFACFAVGLLVAAIHPIVVSAAAVANIPREEVKQLDQQSDFDDGVYGYGYDPNDYDLFWDIDNSPVFGLLTPPDHDGYEKEPESKYRKKPKYDWKHIHPESCGADVIQDETPIWARRMRPQFPIDAKAFSNETLIHLNIAAFRDGPRCAHTLLLLFQHAEYPDRVRVSVLDQYTHLDPLCEDGFKEAVKVLCEDIKNEKDTAVCMEHKMNQVNFGYLPAEQSSGPVTARAMVQQIQYHSSSPPDSSDFCLLLDSHMKFKQNWDTVLLRDWAIVGNENAVLTTYVPDHIDPIFANLSEPLPEVTGGARTHDFKLNENSMPRVQTGIQLNPARSLYSPVWCAGFSFSRCHFNQVIPFDPYLHGIFDGEEMSIALRGYTHGYDFYTNAHQVIAHEYSKRTYPKPVAGAAWWSNDNGKHSDGESKRVYGKKRLWGLFGLPFGGIGPSEKYFKIGDVRSAQGYFEMMQFDPANLTKVPIDTYKDEHTPWMPPAMNSVRPVESYNFPPIPEWQLIKPDQEVEPKYPGWPWQGMHSDYVSYGFCVEFLTEVERSIFSFPPSWRRIKDAFVHNGYLHCKAMTVGYFNVVTSFFWSSTRKLRFALKFGVVADGDLTTVENTVVGLCSNEPGALLETALDTWGKRLPINLVAVPRAHGGGDHNGVVTKSKVGDQEYDRLDVARYPEETGAHGNIFALLKHLYQMNPNSEWYLIGYEETVFAPGSVKHYQRLHPSNKPFLRGKCVTLNQDNRKINFAVGGSGFMLSRIHNFSMSFEFTVDKKTE